MKGRYWNYLGASLMPQLASYVISIPLSVVSQIAVIPSMLGTGMMMPNSRFYEELERMSSYGYFDINVLLEFYRQLFSMMIIPLVIVSLLSILTTLFIIQPVTVGMNRWFIRSREDRNISLSMCFSVFKKGSYLKTVRAMAYSMFFLFLWSLLLYIPAIIKSYAYRMIPYIIADNPGIGAKRALKLSCRMTKGHKFEIFILDVSFIGWYILGVLACCIGTYAVVPYQLATNAELYDELKRDAVAKSLCTMEELGYIRVASETIAPYNA